MLNIFKKTMRKTKFFELAQKLDYVNKPFTKALIYMASRDQDAAIADLNESCGPLRREITTPPGDLDGFAENSAITVAHSISNESAKTIGKTNIWLPGVSIPIYAGGLIAFELWVLTGIIKNLKHENINLDFSKVSLDCASLYCLFRSDEDKEVERVLGEGIQKYHAFIKDKELAEVSTQWFNKILELLWDKIIKSQGDSANMDYTEFGKTLEIFYEIIELC